jgi:hypothetical protein
MRNPAEFAVRLSSAGTMNLVVIAVIILVVLVIAVALLKAKSGASEGTAKPDVYYLRKSLFTPAERSFAGVLETLNLDGAAIAANVRLADIFGVKKGLERGDRQRAQNRINAKHVDFLLIQKSDGRPLLGIELDDSSHEEEDRSRATRSSTRYLPPPRSRCFTLLPSQRTIRGRFVGRSTRRLRVMVSHTPAKTHPTAYDENHRMGFD